MLLCYKEEGGKKKIMLREAYDQSISDYITELADTGIETCDVLDELYDSMVKTYCKHIKYNSKDCEKISVIYDDIEKLRNDFIIIKGEKL